MSSKLDRKTVYDFLSRILVGESETEALAMLKDIVVDYFVFDGRNPDATMDEYEREISYLMSQPDAPGQKISVIKKVRDETNMGLAEAKQFVESLMPGHPSYGKKMNLTDFTAGNGLNDVHNARIRAKLNKIAEDYRVDGV